MATFKSKKAVPVKSSTTSKTAKKEKKEIRARIFNISQNVDYKMNDEQKKFDKEHIEKCINKSKMLKNSKYAYILHDKDDTAHHYHVVIQTNSAIELKRVAELFEIPANFVQIPKGKGAFSDCVNYLTHRSDAEQDKNKFLYSDDEVIASSAAWRLWREKIHRSKDDELTELAHVVELVMSGSIDIQKFKQTNPLFFIKHKKQILEADKIFLESAPFPVMRMNFYVTGGGGTGKSLLSKSFARSLYPSLVDDDKIFFEVGSTASTAFLGYRNQPILIWNDCRSNELFHLLGNRGNIFDVFDVAPTSKQQNIKYGSVALKNSINIINSAQPYDSFLKSLAGEYVDKFSKEKIAAEDLNQSVRRFPSIFLVDFEHITLLNNIKNIVDSSIMNYVEVVKTKNILLDATIKNIKNNDKKLFKQIEEKQCKDFKKYIVDTHVIKNKNIKEDVKKLTIDDFDVDAKFIKKEDALQKKLLQNVDDLSECVTNIICDMKRLDIFKIIIERERKINNKNEVIDCSFYVSHLNNEKWTDICVMLTRASKKIKIEATKNNRMKIEFVDDKFDFFDVLTKVDEKYECFKIEDVIECVNN